MSLKWPALLPARHYRDPAETVKFDRELARDKALRALAKERDRYGAMARRANGNNRGRS